MKCPNCNETLIMADRQGVEIDYCPNCRGVWLDRGELDKIIERTSDYTPPPQQSGNQGGYYGDDKKYYDHDKKPYPDQYNYNDPRYRHKKKKGFLGDFFDFD